LNISEQIHKDIYSFLIKDWKNTSLIVDKSNNKAFSSFLKNVVEYSLDKTNFFFNYEVIETLTNSQLSDNYKIKLLESLNKIYYDKSSFSSSEFSKRLINFLATKYDCINSLRPQGWETFILNHQKNKNLNIDTANYYNNISAIRQHNFNGFHFTKEENFYDNVSIQISGYKYFNHNVYPFENLVDSIVKYVIEINSLLYTKQLTNKIIKICKNENDFKSEFSDYFNYQEVKLNFEIEQENLKQREDITKILKKISTN
jgi:hypothetical protein